MAYPVGTDTQLVLSQTSAIRAGKVIKVKAKNVDRDCEVVFSVEGRGNDSEDYDIASAFSGANYSTAYTGIAVPETAGEYKIQADFEAGCKAEVNRVAKTSLSTSFQVGKITSLTTPVFTATQNLLARRPTLNFSGTLNVRNSLTGTPVALSGQTVLVSVTVQPLTGAAVTLPAIKAVTNAQGTYIGKQALTTRNLKGSYTVTATFVPTDVKQLTGATSSASSSISIASVKAKIVAEKAAKLAAAKHVANINKLTR
jgi:hypothetical protein